MTAPRWPSARDRRAEIAKLYGQIGNKRKVAQRLRLRYETVDYDLSLWQREHPGQPFPGRAQRRRTDRMERAVRLRAEGLTLREIAAQLWCHYTTVRNDLRRWNQSGAALLNPAVEKGLPGNRIQQANSTAEIGGQVVPLIRQRQDDRPPGWPI